MASFRKRLFAFWQDRMTRHKTLGGPGGHLDEHRASEEGEVIA